ncbi:MAG: DoxX family protein [Nanoarchaeota archaeon]
MECSKGYGLAMLRITTGALFLVPGIMKLVDPAGITGMLAGLGFPAASLLAWVLLLSEIIFGASLIVGWKTKYTAWPLVIVLLVATLTVALPAASQNPMGWINVLFHLVGIGALISIALDGPGTCAVSKCN